MERVVVLQYDNYQYLLLAGEQGRPKIFSGKIGGKYS